jgi:SAM-dependent methyltransferase
MKFDNHPLYRSVPLTKEITDYHLSNNHSVLQLFQLPPDEKTHSGNLLSFLNPLPNAHIVSLGCGVAGMERYWKELRPDLSFTLVNKSAYQLEQCLCDGAKVCEDIETYKPCETFDVVVFSYVLGHIDAESTLDHALEMIGPGGFIFIYDVFNASQRFRNELFYTPPTTKQITTWAYKNNLDTKIILNGGFGLGEVARETCAWIVSECVPALFIFQKG